MDFWCWFAFFEFILLVQIPVAYDDGTLTSGMFRKSHGLHRAHGLLEQGDFLADVFIVSPLMAWVMAKHDVWTGWVWPLSILGAAIGLWTCMSRVFVAQGVHNPNSYAYDGKMSRVGICHGAYFVIGFWVMIMAYIGPMEPTFTRHEYIVASSLLTVWVYLGPKKFSSHHRFCSTDIVVGAGELAVFWGVTGYRLAHSA
jgi:hypothetical protein